MAGVHTVIKVGGSLLRQPALFSRAARVLSRFHGRNVVVVPGGGPLADAVRRLDRRLHAGDDASHWMAILAMDQHAHLLAHVIESSLLVRDPASVARATAAGRLPILAPYQWLGRDDPLPHSWAVTSDSIAAWIASRLQARRLVLLKPVGGPLPGLVDEHFSKVLSTDCQAVVLPADSVEELESLLAPVGNGGGTRSLDAGEAPSTGVDGLPREFECRDAV